MTLVERIHEDHLRRHPDAWDSRCPLCERRPELRLVRPEWVRRAQEHRLPVKEYTKA